MVPARPATMFTACFRKHWGKRAGRCSPVYFLILLHWGSPAWSRRFPAVKGKILDMNQGQMFQADDQVVCCSLESGMALLDLRSSKYFSLNPTASFIWKELAEPKSIDGLVDAMTSAFDVDKDVCRSDIVDVLNHFEKLGVVATPN